MAAPASAEANHTTLEARLEIALASCCDMLFQSDLAFRYTWIANPIAPLTRELLHGRTDAEIFPAAEAEQLTAIKRRALASGGREVEVLDLPFGPTRRLVEVIAEPWLGPDGRPAGVGGQLRQVADPRFRQQSPMAWLDMLLRILDGLHILVYLADMETYELLYLNAYGVRLFGTESLGKRCFEALQKGQPGPCAFCTNPRLKREPGANLVWEFQNTATGRWFLCIDEAVPWFDGRTVRMEAAVDITDRKEAERFREEYVSLVSHDLRSPLTALLTRAGALERRLGTLGLEAEAASAASLTRIGTRMSAMIQDLVETVRLESGTLALRHAEVELPTLLRGLVDRLGSENDGRRIELRLPEPLRAVVDAERFERALANLLGNALKYSAPDTPVVVTAVEEAGPGTVLLAVSDRGPGIPRAELPRVFERFFRGRRDASHEGGFGLGLYIARLIVEAHGGKLWAESEEGVGSTFFLRIPRGAKT